MAAVNENPVVCDSLSAMMDELEEGTLLSLLEDRELFSYLQNLPMAPSGDEAEDDLDLTELFGDDALLPDYFTPRPNEGHPSLVDNLSNEAAVSEAGHVNGSRSGSMSESSEKEPPSPAHSGGSESDISNIDSNDSDLAEDALVLSRPVKRRKVESVECDGLFLRSCVEHDHCYTSTSRLSTGDSSPTEKDAPGEEDTGT